MWPSEIPSGAAGVSRPPAPGVSRPPAVVNDLHHARQQRLTPGPRPSPGPPDEPPAEETVQNEEGAGTAEPEVAPEVAPDDIRVEVPDGTTLGSHLDLSG